ncbi:MAG: hypothetical protein F7C38_06890 [Desulfurococcales archaeon]|nr:hypothetical protein [Desulfurococcales archaeon]
MARLRLRYMSKKNKMLFEIGIGLVLIIIFLGFLNAVTTTKATPVLTTEDLWEHANTTIIGLMYVNASDTSQSTYKYYSLADVATYYDGYLYISIPRLDGFVLRTFSLFNMTGADVVTGRYIVEHGANKMYIYMEPINSTAVTFMPTWRVGRLYLFVDTGNGKIWPWEDTALIKITSTETTSTANDTEKWRKLWPDNGTVNREIDVDLASVAIKITGKGDNIIGIARFMGDIQNLDGLKVKIAIYAVSEKPVLSAITEPVYSVIATLYTGILAVARRVKQYATTLFGGFFTHFSLTALIGDPVVALLLTVVFITIVFVTMKKR